MSNLSLLKARFTYVAKRFGWYLNPTFGTLYADVHGGRDAGILHYRPREHGLRHMVGSKMKQNTIGKIILPLGW